MELPAQYSIHGHNKGGILVLVRSSLKVSAVVKSRIEVGECMSLVIQNTFRLKVIYRRPELQTAADIDTCLQWFDDVHDHLVPTFFVGDYNW